MHNDSALMTDVLASIDVAVQAAKFSEATGVPIPKPLTWHCKFYDATGAFPSGWYECPGWTGSQNVALVATHGWNRKKRRGEPWKEETIRHSRPGQSTSASVSHSGRTINRNLAMRASGFWMDPRPTSIA